MLERALLRWTNSGTWSEATDGLFRVYFGSEPALRYLSAGDWVEVITLWKFAGPRRAPPLAAAAE